MQAATPAWTDMAAEALVRVTMSGPAPWAGVAVRMDSTGACYALVTYWDSPSGVVLYHFGAPGSAVASIASVSKAPAIGVWVSMRLWVIGTVVSGSARWGTTAVSLAGTDSALTSGQPGINYSSSSADGCSGDFAYMRAARL